MSINIPAFLKMLTSSLLLTGTLAFGLNFSPVLAEVAHEEIVLEECPQSSRELELPVVRWCDQAISPRGIIVAVHGLTLYSETFDAVARELASKGYPVYACDIRGFGKWLDKSSTYTENSDGQVDFDKSKDDLVRLVTYLRSKNADLPLYMMGESLGANLSLWLASEHPTLTDGLILSALCYKANVQPRFRWAKDVLSGVINPQHPMKLEPYIVKNLSDDEEVTRSYIEDERIRKTMTPVKLIKAALTNRKALAKVSQIESDLPILILAGEVDGLYKADSLRKLVKRIGSKNTDIHILESKGHLLLEHQEPSPAVKKLINDWIASQSELVHLREQMQILGLAESIGAGPILRVP